MQSGRDGPLIPVPLSSVSALPFQPGSSFLPPPMDPYPPPPPPKEGLPPTSPDIFVLSFTYPPPPSPIQVPTSAPIKKPPNYTGFIHPPPTPPPPPLSPGEKVQASASTFYANVAGMGLPEHKSAAIAAADECVGSGKGKIPQWCWEDMRKYGRELEGTYGVKAEVKPSRKRKQYREEKEDEGGIVDKHAAQPLSADKDPGVGRSTSSAPPSRSPMISLPPPRVKVRSSQSSMGLNGTTSPITINSGRSSLDPSSPGSGWNASLGAVEVNKVDQKRDQEMDAFDDEEVKGRTSGHAETISLPSYPSRSPEASHHDNHKAKNRSTSADSGVGFLDTTDLVDRDTRVMMEEDSPDLDSESDMMIDQDEELINMMQYEDDDASTIITQGDAFGREMDGSSLSREAGGSDDGDVRCAGWEWTLKGTWQAVIAARADIYKTAQPILRCTLRVPGQIILARQTEAPDGTTSEPDVLPIVRDRLDSLVSSFGVWITIVSSIHELSIQYAEAYSAFVAGGKDLSSQSAKEAYRFKEEREAMIRDGRDHEIVILGQHDQLEAAKRGLLVMVDQLSGFSTAELQVPMHLQTMLSGRKRAVLTTITSQTGAYCYLPTPDLTYQIVRDDLVVAGGHEPRQASPIDLTSPGGASANVTPQREGDRVVITGSEYETRRVKTTIGRLATNKSGVEQPEKVYCVPQKLDYLLTRRSDAIRRCMHDNGTFVSFPPLGSEGNVLEVAGDDDTARTRTMKQVTMMTCELACARGSLLPAPGIKLPNAKTLSSWLKDIVADYDLDLITRDAQFELWGAISDLRNALDWIASSGLFSEDATEARIQLELSLEDKDFIQGKYSGKTRRIMRASEARLKMQNFNGYTLLVEIGGSLDNALLGFAMLAEELPTNISFCIPYNHHRRLIGRYGDAIQAIMRRYSCYIRMGAPMTASGSIETEDNVWAQTPAKFSHSHNLLGMRREVLELIDETDRGYSLTSVDVPRQYHRALQSRRASTIKAIERQTGATIFFPAPQSGEDAIYIYGSKASTDKAKYLLSGLMTADQNIMPELVHAFQAGCGVESPMYPPQKPQHRWTGDHPVASGRIRTFPQRTARDGRAFESKPYGRAPVQGMQGGVDSSVPSVRAYDGGYEHWNNKTARLPDHRTRSATVNSATSMDSSSTPTIDIDMSRKASSPDSGMTMTSTIAESAILVSPTIDRIEAHQNIGYSWLASGAGPGGVGGQYHVVQNIETQRMPLRVSAKPQKGVTSGTDPSLLYGSAASAYCPDWATMEDTEWEGGTGPAATEESVIPSDAPNVDPASRSAHPVPSTATTWHAAPNPRRGTDNMHPVDGAVRPAVLLAGKDNRASSSTLSYGTFAGGPFVVRHIPVQPFPTVGSQGYQHANQAGQGGMYHQADGRVAAQSPGMWPTFGR